MKKIYSVILLLAVMLSSCTKDETVIMTDDNSYRLWSHATGGIFM